MCFLRPVLLALLLIIDRFLLGHRQAVYCVNSAQTERAFYHQVVSRRLFKKTDRRQEQLYVSPEKCLLSYELGSFEHLARNGSESFDLCV